MIEEAKHLYGYAIMDSPPRILKNLGLNDAEIASLKQAFAQGGPEAVGQLVTDDLVSEYQIAGTPEQCRRQLQHLIGAHDLDAFFVNIISPGPTGQPRATHRGGRHRRRKLDAWSASEIGQRRPD